MPVILSRPWTTPKSTTGLVKFNLNYFLQSQLILPAHSVSMKADKFPMNKNALFTLSADSKEELDNLINQHVLFFNNNSNSELSPFHSFIISSTSSSDSEKHKKHRVAIIVQSLQEIHTGLIDRTFFSSQNSLFDTRRPKIAFLFTGQGSQYLQMAKSLYTTSSIFNQAFNSAATLLQDKIDIPIWDVIWGNDHSQLDKSIYSQTSIFCIECGLVALWKSFGIQPDYVLGPSAGGFAAAVASKTVSLQDGVKLVAERSKLISALPRGGMTSVRANVSTVNSLIKSCTQNSKDIWLDIAVINSENDIVVAGRPEALDLFENQCGLQGLKHLRLAATQAFHSREIEAILEDYGDILESIGGQECLPDLDGSGCPYISGVNGKVLNKEDFSTSYWQSHARDPVDLPKAINTLWDEGCRVFIEVGPSPVLLRDGINILGQTKANEGMWLPSIRKDQNNWDTMLESLAKLYVSGFELNLC